MNRHMRLMAVAALVALAGEAGAIALAPEALLTNFASATFNLPGGASAYVSSAGYDQYGQPNVFTAWVCITDNPQLCMKSWKISDVTEAAPNDPVCFTISFSNCGGYSGFSVLVTDVMPGNTRKGPGPNPWAAGGLGIPQPPVWATSLAGPWYQVANDGQIGPLYLRWLLSRVGMHKTGYIKYCVTIL